LKILLYFSAFLPAI